MSTPTDDELIGLAQTGDRAAFGVLVRRHQQAAIRVAAVASGTAVDADDVAQEAFVKAFRSIGTFRVGHRFEPWLFRIVANTAKNHHRGNARRGALHVRIAALAATPATEPGEVVEQRLDNERVVDALNRLPAKDRLILTYRWYEQLSEAEIATALGCRPGTVKSRLNRSHDRLRRILEDQ